jgi:probable HAF family extracellular repeat protein
MRFLSWFRHPTLDNGHARAGRCRRRRPRSKPAAARLHLEPLEDRWCPNTSYNVTDLGTLGGTNSYAAGINASGQVVGIADTGSHAEAFLWTPTTKNGTTGGMIDLGTLGGTSSTLKSSAANAINASGQVVGEAITASGAFHAFLWTPTTANGTKTSSMIDLGTLGGTTSIAWGINLSGQVVGEADTTGGQRHAFLWTPTSANGTTGSMIDLGTLGGTGSTASGINDLGQVTGNANLKGDTVAHAFLWQISVMTDLGTLGGDTSVGRAINSCGEVAGWSNPKDATYVHAFRWTPTTANGTTGRMNDLGTLNTGTTIRQSDAYGIDDSGVVVGTFGSDLGMGAFYWPGKGSIEDLSTLIPANSGFGVLQVATGINHSGEIVGDGQLPSQPVSHAFLLTPISGTGKTAALAIRQPASAVHLAPPAPSLLATGQPAMPAAPLPVPAAPSAPPASPSGGQSAPSGSSPAHAGATDAVFAASHPAANENDTWIFAPLSSGSLDGV